MNTEQIKIKKLLFLDIDGVMTSTVDGTSLLNLDPPSYSLSSNATDNLMSILDSKDVKVVIHSSWVKWRDYPDYEYVHVFNNVRYAWKSLLFNLIELLSNENAYLDCTHHVSGRNKKGDIEEWLENNKSILDPDCRIAILDDDLCMGLDEVSFGDHRIEFFHCNAEFGMTAYEANEVKIFFGG